MECTSFRYLLPAVLISVMQFSCIDRETIAGSGKEPPARMEGISGNLQHGIVRQKLPVPLKVRILDANERPVRGIGVLFFDKDGRVSFSDTIAHSNSDGIAQSSVTLGSVSDTSVVTASVAGVAGSPVIFSLITLASVGTNAVKAGGDNQIGEVGMTLSLPIRVRIVDEYQNPSPKVAVRFSADRGSVISASDSTDGNGIVSARWMMDTLIGVHTMNVAIPSLPSVSLQFTATAVSQSPASIEAVSNKDVHAMSGAAVPGGIQVRLRDRYGNPASSIVRFSIVEGNPLIDTSRNFFSGSDGIATASIILSHNDTVSRVYAYTPERALLREFFLFHQYAYSALDSLVSSSGSVTVHREKQLNRNFLNYAVERCSDAAFGQNTSIVQTVTDENVRSVTDTDVQAGASLFYRVRINYLTGFYFYTNIRQVTVLP